MQITYERVHELFKYDGKVLIRNVAVSQGTKKGDVAGYIRSNGYRYIKVDYKTYIAQRLVWLFHYGYLPENDIDHINRKRADNRIKNLREVSPSCNLRNCGNYSNSYSGVKGVNLRKNSKTWKVRIGVAGKNYILGSVKDFDEAVLLRLAAEQCLNWESCDTNSPARQYAIKNNLFNPPCL